jgi:hypothetical protein
MNKSNNMEYKSCIKCKLVLTKSNEDYCSNCKHKLSSTKSTTAIKFRARITRFNNNNNSIKCLQNKYSGFELGILYNVIVFIC